MSRIAKKPVPLPQGVEVTLDGSLIKVKGPKGALEWECHQMVEARQEGGELLFSPRNGGLQANALTGTTRSLVANMVEGVSAGFERKLELHGVGYRAQAQGSTLNLSLGLSHPVAFEVPDGISVETPSQTEVIIRGVDKQRVGETAAKIRRFRPPEPYKGKGVRYAGERILLKDAKKK
jgi:large subunit ribosomal protein L6